jgi:hypothetical protein
MRPERRKATQEAVERMRKMLTLGRWPTGDRLWADDRRIIQHNLELAERELVEK